MRKGTRIVKRLLALFLVVLMSINSFGAVVSDNDGSAFITKAEFDSLKNNFQSQIDQYNTSIDSKIDGAIASYLSGIKIQKVTTIKPEFNGTRLLVANIEKIDDLKFGKMDFKVNASMMNFAEGFSTNGWDETITPHNNASSGAGMVIFERIAADGKHGDGFEVFRTNRNNRIRYYDDLRFLWTASIYLAGNHGSAASTAGDRLYLRWHGWYNGAQTSIGDRDEYSNNQGKYYSDLLSNVAWLGFHQSGGIGIWSTSWGVSEGKGVLTNYVTSVNAFDEGKKYIICTNGTDGIEAPNICQFSNNDWSTDLFTQQDSMYDYYDVSDTSDYRHNLPSDAGLTKQEAASWTMNNWQWFNKDSSVNYHNASVKPTYMTGLTWTRTGKFDVRPEDATTDMAQDFYELTIKLGSKELNLLKNDVALDDVSGTYNGWEGYLYQGLPLYSFSQAGKIIWEIDLSSVTEDLYLIVRDQPLVETLNASDYVTENLDSKIDSIKIDNSVSDKAGVILTAGSNHVVTINTNGKTDVFYKLVPVDVDSKLRNVVFVPKEITFESAD